MTPPEEERQPPPEGGPRRPARTRSSRPRSSSRSRRACPLPRRSTSRASLRTQLPPRAAAAGVRRVPRARAGVRRCAARGRRQPPAEPSQAERRCRPSRTRSPTSRRSTAARAPEEPRADGRVRARRRRPTPRAPRRSRCREVVIGAGAAAADRRPPTAAYGAAGAPRQAAAGRATTSPAPKPKRYWWRFSLASFVIVAAIAAATASSILLYLNDIADALSHGGKLHKKLEPAAHRALGGAAEHPHPRLRQARRHAGRSGPLRHDDAAAARPRPVADRADVDPPRPQGRTSPATGSTSSTPPTPSAGPKLTLRMVKRLTGLQINHVVNVDFLGFVRAIDAIGCVWADVDRRYYHSNVGVPAVPAVLRDQHQGRLPAALRQGRARLRALPPHRHRPGPLRAPAGLPARGAPAGPDRRPCSATTRS